MDYTRSEYIDMIACLGWAEGNGAAAARRYRDLYPHRARFPGPRVIENARRRAYERVDVVPRRGANGGPRVRQRTAAREELVLDAFARDPCTSSRIVGLQLGMSHTTVNAITRADGLRPFHKCPVQELRGGDPEQRLNFCEWLVDRHEEDDQFIYRILFTDESNFNQSGARNCHNEHFYDHENPHVTRTRGHQIRFNVNMWCGIVGTNITRACELPMRLNGLTYLQFLREELPELLEDVPLDRRQRMWFQHDGAPAHFTRMVQDWLDESFPNKWIGRGGTVNWPARSPDLNPLDFFLWGHVKSHVYGRDRPRDVHDLCDRIHEAVGSVTEEMLHRTLNNMIIRARKCIEVGGGHFEQLM